MNEDATAIYRSRLVGDIHAAEARASFFRGEGFGLIRSSRWPLSADAAP